MTEKSREEILAGLGLLTPEEVANLAGNKDPFLVEDFLLKPSINIICGHSGLGKSALCMQLGICIAAGLDFLSYNIDSPGPVLYADQESTPKMMTGIAETLSSYLGMDKVPEQFYLWNPTWTVQEGKQMLMPTAQQLYQRVQILKPKLVILDSLRNFYPFAIKNQEDAGKMIKEMRKWGAKSNTSWLIVHHLRKTDREERANNTRPTIRSDVRMWLEEAAGTFALINNTDTRLGWEQIGGEHQIWFGGFMRVHGDVGPFKIVRDLDEQGDAMGYRLASPKDQLPPNMSNWLDTLLEQQTDEISFHDLRTLGMSKAGASRFIRKLTDLGIIRLSRTVESEDPMVPATRYYRIQRDQLWEEESQ